MRMMSGADLVVGRCGRRGRRWQGEEALGGGDAGVARAIAPRVWRTSRTASASSRLSLLSDNCHQRVDLSIGIDRDRQLSETDLRMACGHLVTEVGAPLAA